MLTKKKILAKNASKEYTNSRCYRQQRKVTVITEKKVAELIASSAKKQKHVEILPRKNKVAQAVMNLNTSCGLTHDEKEDIVVSFESSSDHKLSDDRNGQCVPNILFSPTFHSTKDAAVGMSDKDLSRARDQTVENTRSDSLNYHATVEDQLSSVDCKTIVTATCPCNTNSNVMDISSKNPDKEDEGSHMPNMKLDQTDKCRDDEYAVLENLSSEVSAIYLAMQHSKLECVDEASHDSISMEGCAESDEEDDFDDFDPYLFIKNLPSLSSIVPTFRPMLLPKQTRSCPSTTLVLDLDETLVHSTLEPCDDADFTFPVNFNFKEHTIYVRCRPFLKDFMERVAGLFEIILFTASQSIYAEQLLNILDPKRKLFRHRVYRESCVFVEGNYLKDLSVLGRDLAHVIIIDNSPQAFGFQVDNGIPIESWFEDRTDRQLLYLLPFLESLIGVEDVRPLIAKKFNLREKIASAPCFTMNTNEWTISLSKR